MKSPVITHIVLSLIGLLGMVPSSFANCAPGQIAHLVSRPSGCWYTDNNQPCTGDYSTMQIISGPGVNPNGGNQFYIAQSMGSNSSALFYSNGNSSGFMVTSTGSCQPAPPPPAPRPFEIDMNGYTLDCQ
jgi:hypothetical protein